MAETKIDRQERKKLTVTWVGEPQPLREGSKVKILRFNADDNLQYEVFRTSLFSHIEVGKTLDADTELQITTTKDGKQYTHWRVTELYEGARKLSTIKQPALADEALASRREEAIQVAVALKEIGECWRHGKLSDDNVLVRAYLAWIISKLEGGKDEVKPTGAQAETDSKPEADEEVSSSQDRQIPMETGGEEQLIWFHQNRDKIEEHAVWLKAYLIKLGVEPRRGILQTLKSMNADTLEIVKEEVLKKIQ